MTYQGVRQRLYQELTPPRPASQRGSSEKCETNQHHGRTTYTTGPATSHKGNFLLYCKRHHRNFKKYDCAFESVQFLPQCSILTSALAGYRYSKNQLKKCLCMSQGIHMLHSNNAHVQVVLHKEDGVCTHKGQNSPCPSHLVYGTSYKLTCSALKIGPN